MEGRVIAETLRLPQVRDLEWSGEWNDLTFGVAQFGGFAPEAEVRLYCLHQTSLRLGMLAQPPLRWGVADPFAHRPRVPIGDLRLDGALQLLAVEAGLARALAFDLGNALVVLIGDGALAIDDRSLWLTLPATQLGGDDVRAVADRMTDLSSRLVLARGGWEADFETAIAPIWSQLAASAGLRWSADNSSITGECHGATFEARVDGEPGVLYTEVYLEWPSLGRGLAIERTAKRGVIAKAPPAEDKVEKLQRAFDRELRGRESGAFEDGSVPAAVLHAALSIATTGASVTLDDTGLALRVDHVAIEDMGTLVRGTLAITKALLAPGGVRGLYR